MPKRKQKGYSTWREESERLSKQMKEQIEAIERALRRFEEEER